MRWLWVLVAAIGTAALPALALAQAPPHMSASADPSTVEVSQPFTVQLDVTVDASSPEVTDPRLTLPPALRASAPSVSTRTQISFVNGRMTRSSGISATWQVVASHEGTFTLGPPSVAWNGHRVQTNGVKVTVLPKGSAPRAGPRGGSRGNPFDPFGMFPNFPDLLTEREPPVTEDPELALETAPDPSIFLRSVAQPTTAVVGEQVTSTVYLYVREGLRASHGGVQEGSAPGFLVQDLLNPAAAPDPKFVLIGGNRWRVYTRGQRALFPLKTGDLSIGSAAVMLQLARGPETRRESQPLIVHVTEPPSKGRPPGYRIGDVGSYTIAASVEPRTAEVGGAVSVVATVTGVGRVPDGLSVPMQTSLEWLEPQVRENLDVEGGRVKGSRTFSYVVRPKIAGEIDLHELTLSFWNPAKGTYEVARAPLGKIRVTPSATAAAADSAPVRDAWSAIGPRRDELGAFRSPGPPLTERPLYWFGLFGAPFSVVLFSLGARGARALHQRMKSRRQSPARAIDQAFADARTASQRGDGGAMTAALDRALHNAIEQATGVRSRGLLLAELPAALAARGVAGEVAEGVRDVLEAVETARFTRDLGGKSDDLIARARATVRELGRAPSRPKES